jgi:uncharacterized protein YggE
MKRTFFCLLATLFAVSAGAAAAQSAPTEITASGTGSISVPPDMATVSAAVETNAANANDAISQNNVRYDQIVAALAKAGIARADIALSYYNVGYNPRPKILPSPPSDERYGYTVSRNFSVKVRAIGDAGKVSDSCIAAGATAINGVSFGLSDPGSVRAQAIAKAVAEARTNAEALAAAAGLRIVALKSIELTNGEFNGSPQPMVMAKTAVPTQFDQSNVNVNASVGVVFLAGP